jgi:hypothetical protein
VTPISQLEENNRRKEEKISQKEIDKLLEDLKEQAEKEGPDKIVVVLQCIYCGFGIEYTSDTGAEIISGLAARPNSFRTKCASETGHYFKATSEDPETAGRFEGESYNEHTYSAKPSGLIEGLGANKEAQ